MRTAAGVLVLEGPRVLAFRRFDREGLSLPCGVIEPGEQPGDAALREGKEETGLDLRLVPGVPPFVGFDTVGCCLVHTFLAEVAGGELLPEAPGEGLPLWASTYEIATGPYWHYNVRALRHFGRRPPLTGKFHSHLTVRTKSQAEAERAANLVGGKLTVIDLSRGDRQQTDVMITHHFVCGARGLEDQYDILAKLRAFARQLEESGVTVLRVKLEYDLLDARSSRALVAAALDNEYTEIHIKCVLPVEGRDALVALAASAGWHPSRNPYSVRGDGKLGQFINRRFYERRLTHADLDTATDALVTEVVKLAEIEEIKFETAVYDSAGDHDRWWMA